MTRAYVSRLGGLNTDRVYSELSNHNLIEPNVIWCEQRRKRSAGHGRETVATLACRELYTV